ncbi:MAG TPA: WYL domain-containing protein [Ktedonobacteraceae bacterium]|nr:WYL domain-containing protein [Ktedonobacteraceae bacterium]
MRADRLLSILLLLQVHQRLTARELAKRLEVSERTIHRDMEALSVSGIPVIAERGLGGGWGLLEEYRTNLTGLTEAEIQTLFLTRPARLLADLGLHKAAEAALIKLLAALPTMNRRDAEYARQRIYVDAAGWHSTEEAVPLLPTLQEAIWQERKLRFTYSRGEATFERVVDPLGLIAKGSIWYLAAAVEGQVRSYRVSRIQEAWVEEQACERPADFDLAEYWIQSSREFRANIPRHAVVVRARQEALPRMLHAGRFIQVEQIDQADEEGWTTARLLFDAKDEMCGYLLSFGTDIEILEPQELREQVVRLAESVAAFYTQKV